MINCHEGILAVSDDTAVPDSSTARGVSPRGQHRSISRTALKKRRMKLLKRHVRLFPFTGTFTNLQISPSLRTRQYTISRRRRSATGILRRRLLNDSDIVGSSTPDVENDVHERRLEDACCINRSSGNNSFEAFMAIDTDDVDENEKCIMEIEDNNQQDDERVSVNVGIVRDNDSDDEMQIIQNDGTTVEAVHTGFPNNSFHTEVSDNTDDLRFEGHGGDNSVEHCDGNNVNDESDIIEDLSNAFSSEELNTTSTSTDDEENNVFSIDNIQDWLEPIRLKSWITKLYMIVSVMAISLRGKLTYTVTSMIFKNMNAMFLNCKLPSTIKNLWTLLSKNDNAGTTRHWYCRTCRGTIGEGEKFTEECPCQESGPGKKNDSLSYFIEVKITPQLKQLFSNPSVVDSLRYRFTRKKINTNALEDIYNGAKYKEKCEPAGFLTNEKNYSFSLFTDGCQVSKSSKASAWPVLLQINELPPHARKRYVILAGVWVDTIHPNLNSTLLPTVKELRELYEVGMRWTNPIDNTIVTSKFVTLTCIADSVARPAILNMTLFNGEYGCTYCYDKGVRLRKRGVVRTYPINQSVSRRTDSDIREHMQKAYATRRKHMGVKGITALAILPEFDLSLGPVVESMHNVYLGVVKLHTQLLLGGSAEDVWYAGTPGNLATINSRLKSIRPPSRIARKPRPIDDMKKWKATEWRNWVEYYALPCLEGIIRECDLQHFALLSRAAHTMNKDSIDPEELQEARLLLKQYVDQFQQTFGTDNMKYNIHLLTHLADTVENWGPFWAHSAFPFESWNKKIIEKVTSANARPLQIVTRFLMTRFMEEFLINETVPAITRRAIHSILTDGLQRRDVCINVTPITSKFCGIRKIEDRPPLSWESEALRSAEYQPETLSIYERAIINGIDYRCREEKDKKKHDFAIDLFIAEQLDMERF